MSASIQTRTAALSYPELSAFCAQVSMILKAGIPLHEGLAVMRDDATEQTGRGVLETICAKAEQGLPLRTALEAAGVFPRYMLDMVEIGETSGKLEEVMTSLASYYDRQESLSQSVRRAVTYPAVMVGMMLLTMLVLVVKVLPVFRRVYQRLGSGVSDFTQGLLRFGSALGTVALVVLCVCAAAALVLLLMRTTAGGRRALSRLARRLPFTRGVGDTISSGRFAASMALMLGSGMDLNRSLELAAQLLGDSPMAGQVQRCRQQVEDGISFADALTDNHIFSGLSARMITVGMRSGSVDRVMERIALQCDQEAAARLEGLVAVLEPTLVAILSVVVGIILVSVMLPLMGVMSSIG